MRIISGNVRQNINPENALKDFFRAVDTTSPDIVCLQEARVDGEYMMKLQVDMVIKQMLLKQGLLDLVWGVRLIVD